MTPLPDRPHESLQNAFREPMTFTQELAPGVGVGQGELGEHGFSQAQSRSAARSEAERVPPSREGLMASLSFVD
jgi:hypothetical protein